MRAKSRRKLEMGERVLEFTRRHPHPSAGYVAASARLQGRLARGAELARQQVDGRAEMRVSTGRKRELRRLIMQAHLDHLASVAEVASTEESELRQKFVYPPDARSYLAFRAVASSMAAEAVSRTELLLKHGLSEDVLTGLQTSLDQFETAVEQGAAGRLGHVGATAELVTVSEEVVQVVKVMNGLIRLLFGNQPETMAAWESASSVVATPRPAEPSTPPSPTPPAGGEIRPAA